MLDDERPRHSGAAHPSPRERTTGLPHGHLGISAQQTDREFQPSSVPYETLLDDLLGNHLRFPQCSFAKRTGGRRRCRCTACVPCLLEKGFEVAQDVILALRWTRRGNYHAHFLTINVTTRDSPLRADIRDRWRRFHRNLRRSCPSLAWVAHRLTWGLSPTGRLHLHAITIGVTVAMKTSP
jgi:hypothetical protein